MSPVFLPFNANLTSIKRWYLNFKWQFIACQVNNCSVPSALKPHHFCSGTTTHGATTEKWLLGRCEAFLQSFQLKSRTEWTQCYLEFEQLRIKFHAFDITDQCQYQKVLWDVSRSCHMISQQWISRDLIKLWDLKSLMRINRILWELCHNKSYLSLE